MQRLQVAAETWLPLGELAFTGRRWQDVRTAINRAAREGVRARVGHLVGGAAARCGTQVAELSEEWLAAKGLPEMGFTLGGLDELDDPAVRCLVAVDPTGHVPGPDQLAARPPGRRRRSAGRWTSCAARARRARA